MLAVFLLSSLPAQALERRKPQFPTEPSYLIFPLPVALPGIGNMIVVTGLAGNFLDTYMDAYALMIFGDVSGSIVAVEDIHLIKEKLIFNFGNQNLSKLLFTSYSARGMNSRGDDYTLLELDKVDGRWAQATLTFLDRRLEFFAGTQSQKVNIPRIRDKDGVIISELTPAYTAESKSTFLGFQIDYTDDRQDPLQGVRFKASRSSSPPQSSVDPEFSVQDLSLTGYVPIGNSTLALHYFRSDAIVSRQGQTDPTAIRAELGFNCGGNAACLARETELVNQFVAARTNGSSTDLGGDERLRSYPGNRFQGAHTEFYALEYRWNFSSAVTPFNYFIWKDVRTGVQVAFFAEMGSVGETRSEVGNKWAKTFGAGLRLVSGSGFVYRADIAAGSEGVTPVIIFNYPF